MVQATRTHLTRKMQPIFNVLQHEMCLEEKCDNDKETADLFVTVKVVNGLDVN
jgi:hypothetical protein